MPICRPLRAPVIGAGYSAIAPRCSQPWEPDAGGGAWQPAFLGAALTWWSKETSLVGSPIDSITNLGSAGGSVSATTTARATVSTINSLNVAAFDGSANVETGGPLLSSVITASAYSLFGVVSLTAYGAAPSLSGFNDASVWTDTATGVFYPLCVVSTGVRAGQFSGAADHSTSVVALSLATAYAFVVNYSAQTLSLTIGGTAATPSSTGSDVGTLTGSMRMGANYNGVAKANVKVAELGVLNRAMTASEQASALAYLKAKWGAT